ncbi:MAG: single-stranded DNA-binding protein [Kouleothrix sp.]|nr:single-stranded DNA-binding protein [Kouleothrix sp.]
MRAISNPAVAERRERHADHEDQSVRAQRLRRQPTGRAVHPEWQDGRDVQPVHQGALERRERRGAREDPRQITAWGAQAEVAQQRLAKGTRVQVIGRIDQQTWGAGAQRQYRTVLVATEIVLVSFAAPEETPAAASADAEQAAATEPSAPEPETGSAQAPPHEARRVGGHPPSLRRAARRSPTTAAALRDRVDAARRRGPPGRASGGTGTPAGAACRITVAVWRRTTWLRRGHADCRDDGRTIDRTACAADARGSVLVPGAWAAAPTASGLRCRCGWCDRHRPHRNGPAIRQSHRRLAAVCAVGLRAGAPYGQANAHSGVIPPPPAGQDKVMALTPVTRRVCCAIMRVTTTRRSRGL